MKLSTRRRAAVTVLAVMVFGLAAAGCDEATRDEIAGAIEDAASEAAPAEDEAPAEEPPAEDEAAAEEPAEEEPAAEEPAEEEPAEEEPAAEEPAAEEDGVPTWVWILGIVVLALLVGLMVSAANRRQEANARRDRLRDAATADVDWLLGAARERAAGIDATSRARDIRMRLDRLTDTLQQLRTGARSDAQVAIDDLRTSARQLADALVARLEDAAAQRQGGADLGIDQLADRLASSRDSFVAALGGR